MYKLSISTMVYLSLPPSKAIERLTSRGFRAIEVSYTNFLVNSVREFAELNRVAEVVSRHSLEVFSIHLPYDRIGVDELSLASTLSRFFKWIRILDRLGVNFYVTHLPELPASEKSIYTAARFIKNIAESVGGNSLILVENTTSSVHIGSSPRWLAEILRSVDTANVGVCVDVGHALVARVPIEEFRKQLGALVRAVHLHDNDGLSDKHFLPGRGILRVSELAEFIAAVKPLYVVAEVACRGLAECDALLSKVRDLKSTLGVST
ncbi:MAG: TIM barrel protein [Sulfolobales archaeon]|nr:sugar phosphate isomerase/epimerase [Sulfolobales archaeon]MDW8083002.1 TIM barrel protein [Sulfolobales archaeon]